MPCDLGLQPGICIGPLPIRFYGIIIVLGILVGGFVATREARYRGENPDRIWDALIWVLIGGIIGARLWHIFSPPPSNISQGLTTTFYLTHPLDALAVWRGGLGIPGAIIGGVFALYLYCRRHGLDIRLWLDIGAPGVALAQAIGRWGNWVNQELYGMPTNLPWAIPIDPQHRVPGFEQFERFHPLFLYESIWNLLNALFLLWLARRFAQRLLPGDIFLVYVIFYSVGRFMLEFLRLDAAQIAGINFNQTMVVIAGLVSAGILVWRHTRKTVEPVS